MIITLTPDIEQALADQAHKLGTTPEQLALDSLRERFASESACDAQSEAEKKRMLAEFLRDYVGVLNSSEHVSGGARMSEDSGKKFAQGMVKQHQERERCP